jgi:hypothetical protein
VREKDRDRQRKSERERQRKSERESESEREGNKTFIHSYYFTHIMPYVSTENH